MQQNSKDICNVSLRPGVVPFLFLTMNSEQVRNAATRRTDEAKNGDKDKSKSEAVIWWVQHIKLLTEFLLINSMSIKAYL